MHQIHNIQLPGDPDLSARVNGIANRLLKDMPVALDNDGDERYQELLERTLLYAARAEQKLAYRDQRIAHLKDLTLTDELTGLLNRRGFVEYFRQALATARRYGQQGMLLYCDLDNFKAINDRLGHAAGDEVLRHASRILMDSVRDCDIVGRLGGDEFAVALVQSSWNSGAKRARTLQYRIESSEIVFEGSTIRPRISIGCEPFGPDDSLDDLVCRADMAMYCTKRRKTETAAAVAAE